MSPFVAAGLTGAVAVEIEPMKLRHRLIALLSPQARGRLIDTKIAVVGFLQRRAQARTLHHMEMLLSADPLEGDYCLALQEPFDKSVRDAIVAHGRIAYCLERSLDPVCPTQCKWGMRIASNRARAAAAERERIAAGADLEAP